MPIQKLIDQALQKEQADRKTRVRSGKFSPSSMGRCYRLQYWNRKKVEPTNPPDARTLRVFRAGRLFHDFAQSFIKPEQVEVKVETDDICGYADTVTEKSVIEFKSIHSRGFWYMQKDGYDVAKEKFTNWLQVMTYAMILKKPFGSLVFISKDDLCIEEYALPLANWIPTINEELQVLRHYWGKDELPPPMPRAYNGKDCTYCQFKILCEQTDGGYVKG